MLIALRCDGNDELGAGHVGRCLPIAQAFARSGHEVVIVGDHDGVALRVLERSGLPRCAPAPGEPSGVPANVDAAIVDVYGESAEVRAATAARRPTILFRDAFAPVPRPPGPTILDYHLDASGDGGLCGPDYAPLDPRFAAARQGPHDGGILIALGGSTVGGRALEPLLSGLRTAGHRRLLVAGALVPKHHHDVEHIGPVAGLHELIGEVSGLCCGASVTAYEAAAAGTPALLAVLVGNQERVGRAFAPMTPVIDVRAGLEPNEAAEVAARLTGSSIPVSGPALVDGHGASRIRDALLQLATGRTPATPLRQRPATTRDEDVLLRWRNDPAVRAVSTASDVVAPQDHARWLRVVLSDPDRSLLVIESGGEAVATARFDRDPVRREAEISVTVAPDARASGIGRRVMRETTERELASRPSLRRVFARVQEDNKASLRALEAAGYHPAATDGTWRTLETVR